jgi:phenolic acid decarboxylase
MTFFFKGSPNQTTSIEDFIQLLQIVSDDQLWEYEGLAVAIDPTVDYNHQNVLVRWHEIQEGFNDKIILYSLLEFQSLFKPKSLC